MSGDAVTVKLISGDVGNEWGFKVPEIVGVEGKNPEMSTNAAVQEVEFLTEEQKVALVADFLKKLEAAEVEYGQLTGAADMRPTDLAVQLIPAQYYDGKAKAPAVVVMASGKTLNKDYKVKYKSNTLIGTAQVVVTGIDSYSGTVTVNFTIDVKKNMAYTVGNCKYKIVTPDMTGRGAFKGIQAKALSKVPKKKLAVYRKVLKGKGQRSTVRIRG